VQYTKLHFFAKNVVKIFHLWNLIPTSETSEFHIEIWKLTMGAVSINVKQWGNSLGIRLPAAIAKASGLKADQCVEVAVKGQTIIITPCKEKPMTLEERLALFDPEKHGAEAMVFR